MSYSYAFGALFAFFVFTVITAGLRWVPAQERRRVTYLTQDDER